MITRFQVSKKKFRKDALNRSFIYDGENKQIEVLENSVSLGKYFYDGDGRRVKKITANETVIFVYDAIGKLIAEYSTQISPTPQVAYLTNDHLGSPRINTDALGSVISRHDYQPFGEEIERASYGTDDIRKQFTGYERDKETDLDFAQARMYNKNLGRFTGIDPILISKEHPPNPQRWNLYIYVINNPLSLIDPDGKNPKVINIFITFEQTSKEGRKQWDALKKQAPKGTTVNIYRIDAKTAAEQATQKKFIQSIKAKDTTTIVVGHSSYNEQESKKEGRYVGNGIEFKPGSVVQDGFVNTNKGNVSVSGINSQNDVIGIFTCDFGQTFSRFGSSNKTEFVSIDNGRNGETNTDSTNQAAFRFAETLVNGGNTRQAINAASQGLNAFRTALDSDDTIQHYTLPCNK